MPGDGATILRIKLGEEPIGQWCTTDTYRQLILASSSKHQTSSSTRNPPLECDLLNGEIQEKTKNLFRKGRKGTTRFLVVDFSSIASTKEKYSFYCDHLCGDLLHRIEKLKKTPSEKLDILLVVSDLNEFLNSVVLQKLLKESCEERGYGLIVAQVVPLPIAKVICGSPRVFSDSGKRIEKIVQPSEEPPKTSASIANEIEQSIDQIFGHFEIAIKAPVPGMYDFGDVRKTHVTTLISLDRCLQDSRVLPYVQSLLEQWAGNDDFVVMPIGIQGADLDGLARGVVNNNEDRFGPLGNVHGRKVAIICDVLWGAYNLELIAEWFKNEGATEVFIISFSKFKGMAEPAIPHRSIIELEGQEYEIGKDVCPCCQQGDDVVGKGYEYLDQFLQDIKSFHPSEFWQLFSSTKGAYLDGHWESEVTNYHYLHRLWCEPVFRKHGYGIGVRIKNMIAEGGIFNEWIDTLLCPDEKQAIMLVENINRAFKGTPKTIIKIPRKYFASVTGTSISPELRKYLEGTYGLNPLQKQNVIIMDQAAHHFGTLTALSNICLLLGGRILGFAVFLDRLHHSISIADELPNSHYVSLYKWPWPPYRSYECPHVHRTKG